MIPQKKSRREGKGKGGGEKKGKERWKGKGKGGKERRKKGGK